MRRRRKFQQGRWIILVGLGDKWFLLIFSSLLLSAFFYYTTKNVSLGNIIICITLNK